MNTLSADRRNPLIRQALGWLLALACLFAAGVAGAAGMGGHAVHDVQGNAGGPASAQVATVAEEGTYPPVQAGHTLRFPRDFGAHPDYRTEWWYITGWLRDAAGAERGFQLTFFRVRTLIGEDNPSLFAPRQLILAHAAVADPGHGRLRHAERSARAFPGLAGAVPGRTSVSVDGWFLEGGDSTLAPYRSRIEAEDFGFELEFVPDRGPVLNGKAGFSQKAPDPINASHYYSRPQLAVKGQLRLDDASFAVEGHAWLDHEWSSEILPEGARGWDWIGINLHDGGGLMAFQMRDEAGSAIWHAATLSDRSGAARIYAADELRFIPLRHWRSPRTGIEYPVEWEVVLAGGRSLRLRPLLDDQELDSRSSTGAIYWEGAVRVFERDAAGDETEIGQGYLEMTGYAARLQM